MSDTHVLQVELDKKKISALRKALDTENSVFLEKRYLESLGPPQKILGREKQAEQLLNLLYLPKGEFLAPLVSVFGRSGTGKSTVVRFVCEEISDVVSYSFVNLRKSKTIFNCANLILTKLDSDPIKSYEGINNAIERIESRIAETLIRDSKKQFVLILDEFDVIFSDSRGKPSDFVFKLLTIVENLRSKGYSLCIVAISNCNIKDFALDDRVKSRMDNCQVFFAPYKIDEIFSILKERSKKAFVNKVDDKVLKLCAELSGSEHGDCRRALQLLRMAGELANGSKISESHVKDANKQLDDDKVTLVLESATMHQKLLLAALAKIVLHSGKEKHSTRAIFEVYQCQPSKVIQRLSYRRAFDLLADLENTGFIVGKKQSGGRHGNQNLYWFTVDYRLVGWQIDPEWWSSEMGEKEKSEIWEEMVKDVRDVKKSLQRNMAIDRARRQFHERFPDSFNRSKEIK